VAARFRLPLVAEGPLLPVIDDGPETFSGSNPFSVTLIAMRSPAVGGGDLSPVDLVSDLEQATTKLEIASTLSTILIMSVLPSV
jgi:hypothetical protein